MWIMPKYRLFSKTWRVRSAEAGEIGSDLGQCRPDQLEIILNPNQSQESMIHTLAHEICHSIELSQDLDMTERQIDLMALGIIDLVRNNPGFFNQFEEAQDGCSQE